MAVAQRPEWINLLLTKVIPGDQSLGRCREAQRLVFMNFLLAKVTQNLLGKPSGVKALPTCPSPQDAAP